MRTELLAYLTANLTATIKPSSELPFQEGNNALYLKNMRRVYLDEPFTEMDRLYGTLDANHHVNQKITFVRAYLAVDAKNRNSDLDAALTTMASAKDVTSITTAYRKEFDYTTRIEDDRLIYEFEYRFYTISS